MSLSRRTALKLGMSAGTLPLLAPSALAAEAHAAQPPSDEVFRARPLPLDAVRLTGGPLKHAQELDARYLLELEPDRMLAYYRERAGLGRRAEPYGGWDGGGRNLTGHIAGHYLSAVSYMFAATGDARFRERADYLVRELKEVQDANRDGYLGALENGRSAFTRLARGEIRSGSFDLNGEWSPWYTLHKTFAGLRDAYRYAGNRTALEVEARYAAWAEQVLAGLNDEQLQHMMNTEFGGMNEVLVDLFADTGERRWLDLSYRFEHRIFMEPLQRHQDRLAGSHGNTAVPKVMGSLARYIHTGRPADLIAASFFWDRVVQHHSFSSGGHGKDEYFGPPDQLSARVDGRTAESCNVYNMIKMTRLLFALRPDPHYADFHERALFNHVLASMDPDDGRTCYMVPVGRGVTREYQDMKRSFTCCVGSGMESHALHGDGLYYEAGDRLWVNIYAPSTAAWRDAGVQLVTETDFPEGERARITLQLRSPRAFALLLRQPWWAGEGFEVRVNGQAVTAPAPPPGMELVGRSQYSPYASSRYLEVDRTWRSGDVVEVRLPKTLRLEPLPDDARRVSLLWGPLVLAGDIGPEPARGPDEGQPSEPPLVPVLVAAGRPVTEWLEGVPGTQGRFRTVGVGREPNAEGREHDVELVPFFRLHRRAYSAYWDLFTPQEWQARKAEYQAETERIRRLEAATTAWLVPGDAEHEARFNYQAGEDAQPQRMLGRRGRRGGSWFSYDLTVDPRQPLAIMATYYSDDRRGMPAHFDIRVDGRTVAEVRLERSEPPRFFDASYPLPPELSQGKERVTVRFQAREGSQIATIFGLRMVRSGQ